MVSKHGLTLKTARVQELRGESARGSGDDDSVVPDFSEIEWLGEMNGVIVQKCRREETCVNLTNNLFQTAKCVSHGQSLR